jgi:hypothetical protein
MQQCLATIEVTNHTVSLVGPASWALLSASPAAAQHSTACRGHGAGKVPFDT